LSIAVVAHGAETNKASRPEPAAADGQASGPKTKPINPVVQLIRDPQIQAELKLNEGQTAQVDERYGKIERELWPLRDAQVGPGAEKRGKLVDQFEQELSSLLEPTQLLRLRQLLVQAQGWQSLTLPRIANELKLSDAQQRQVDQIVTSTAAKLQLAAAGAQPAAEREKANLKLRREEGAAIQKLLGVSQRKQLAELVGPKYNVSSIRALTYTAPQLGQIDRWINTQPLA
jgi:hypothetical protein